MVERENTHEKSDVSTISVSPSHYTGSFGIFFLVWWFVVNHVSSRLAELIFFLYIHAVFGLGFNIPQQRRKKLYKNNRKDKKCDMKTIAIITTTNIPLCILYYVWDKVHTKKILLKFYLKKSIWLVKHIIKNKPNIFKILSIKCLILNLI